MSETQINETNVLNIKDLNQADIVRLKEVVQNTKTVEVIIHPGYGLVREGWEQKQQEFRKNLFSHIGTSDNLVFIFEEGDKVSQTENEIVKGGDKVIIVPTRRNSPTPSIEDKASSGRQFEKLKNTLDDLGVENVILGGIGYTRTEEGALGCVAEAEFQLQNLGYNVDLQSKYCFPDSPITSS